MSGLPEEVKEEIRKDFLGRYSDFLAKYSKHCEDLIFKGQFPVLYLLYETIVGITEKALRTLTEKPERLN